MSAPLTIERCLRQRPFAYSTIYEHPPLPYPAFGANSHIKPEIPPEIGTLCKNESNVTFFLPDGRWWTTWSQGSHEHSPDERIVYAESIDEGRTWSAPRTIVGSTPEYRIAYGCPFLVEETGRIYMFFFRGRKGERPFFDSGTICFLFTDDFGATWSEVFPIQLPGRDLDVFPGEFHGWVNHAPERMPTGEIILPFSANTSAGLLRRAWILTPAEVRVLRCDNLAEETDPARLRFSLLPDLPWGIRADPLKHHANPTLRRLFDFAGGFPVLSAFNFQEMTVVPLPNGHWLGVGRCYLGSPGYTISRDRGASWSDVEPLHYSPDGPPIKHPMTMCPIALTSDQRIVLLFTNNDGSDRGARHAWDGGGRTRNPQWIAVGRWQPGEERNGGLIFGEPRILVDVDDSGETNLKTGISMPHFFERKGRYFVAYNINKEHLLLDEIPAAVLDEMTP